MSNEKWYDDEKIAGGGYLSLNVGEEVTLTVTEINKVEDKPDYEPKKKDGESQGFLFEFVGAAGTLSATTYKLQSVLRNAKVTIGDTIKASHPKHGEYTVEKI